jgi:hypothetical protein
MPTNLNGLFQRSGLAIELVPSYVSSKAKTSLTKKMLGHTLSFAQVPFGQTPFGQTSFGQKLFIQMSFG